jgi:hypothetical protein
MNERLMVVVMSLLVGATLLFGVVVSAVYALP